MKTGLSRWGEPAIAMRRCGSSLAPLALAVAMVSLPAANAADWKSIRTAPDSAGAKWTEVPCTSGTTSGQTWQLCQPPLEITVTASPASIAGTGATSSTITALVNDLLGNPVEAGIRVDWATTNGTLSVASSLTDVTGKATVVLTSSLGLGSATVTATNTAEGGTGSVSVSFSDSWVDTDASFTDWVNSGGIYGCSNWSPDPATKVYGTPFIQTATDCEQNQTRTQQNLEQSEVTGALRNDGAPITLARTLGDQTSTRSATGTMYTWSPTTSVYSAWTNSGSAYDCTAWSPAANTIASGTSFTQYRTCSQNQTGTRQDREKNDQTGAIRNVGSAVAISQTVSVTQSQAATGTLVVNVYGGKCANMYYNFCVSPTTGKICQSGWVYHAQSDAGVDFRGNATGHIYWYYPAIAAATDLNMTTSAEGITVTGTIAGVFGSFNARLLPWKSGIANTFCP